jgi:hypothetical protein
MSSGNLNVYLAEVHTGNGRTKPFGDMQTPIAALTLAGAEVREWTMSIAPGAYDYLYRYDQPFKRFGYIRARIVGDGFGHVFSLQDKPTSTSNYAPLGTHKDWRQESISNRLPFVRSSDHALVNPVLADVNSDTAGLPTLMSDAGTVDGKVYDILIRNPASATAAIVVETLIAGWD